MVADEYLSASAALGLIAYGREDALGEAAPGEPPMIERWHTVAHWHGGERSHPLVRDMRWVLARVRWWKSRKRQARSEPVCRLPPLETARRASVRRVGRGYRKPLADLLNELRSDVRKTHQARKAHMERVEVATAKLCKAVAERRAIAWGRPGTGRDRTFKSRVHEPIPPEFFINQHNTITIDDWATSDPGAPIGEWLHTTGPEWGDVRFERREVLRICQLANAAEPQVAVPDRRPRPTDRAVRQWMRDRVAEWSDNLPAPSEERDWHAVTQQFAPGLTRDEFRLIREAEAPDEWRKQGPRKPWGQVKQSANLRPQN